MKSVIYGIVLVMLLSGVVGASTSCVPSEPTGEHYRCFLNKPVHDVIVGDPLTVECEHRENQNSEYEPVSRASINIVGYDDHDEAIFSDRNSLDRRGKYSFSPRFAGDYLIQISSCDYNARFEVGEDPNAEEEVDNAITGGAVAADNSEDEPEENETEGNSTEEAEPPEEGGEENSAPGRESDLLDIMINGTKSEEDKKVVSNFGLMLVGLLIS